MSIYFDPDLYIAQQEKTVIANVKVLTLDSMLKTRTMDNPQMRADIMK
jgi:hypothetical protein